MLIAVSPLFAKASKDCFDIFQNPPANKISKGSWFPISDAGVRRALKSPESPKFLQLLSIFKEPYGAVPVSIPRSLSGIVSHRWIGDDVLQITWSTLQVDLGFFMFSDFGTKPGKTFSGKSRTYSPQILYMAALNKVAIESLNPRPREVRIIAADIWQTELEETLLRYGFTRKNPQSDIKTYQLILFPPPSEE